MTSSTFGGNGSGVDVDHRAFFTAQHDGSGCDEAIDLTS